MLTKLLALLLAFAAIGRWLLAPRWGDVSRWFKRSIDIAIVVLALALVVQLVMVVLH